jgi:putative FmdB family regulatory protein
MPIYEYRCENGHTFEVMQRITDDPVATCTECGAPVQRVFHPVAVHFKGSGFYNTDYGTRKRAREQKESGDGGSDGKSETAKTDTKKESTASSNGAGGDSKPAAPAAKSSASGSD